MSDIREPTAGEMASALMGTGLEDSSSSMKFATVEETDELRIWEGGIYAKGGEARIRERLEQLPGEFSTGFKNEVIRHIKDRTLHKSAEFELPENLIPFANVIYDLETGKTIEYSSNIIFSKRLAAEYDPSANCPDFLAFLKASHPNGDNGGPDRDTRRRLLEHFASCLDRRKMRRRALFNVGPPYSGKTVFLNVEGAFLGLDNVSNISLQEICKSRFSPAQLYDKALNFYADLPEVKIDPLDKFKLITGGDRFDVEFKGRDPFPVWPHVKLHFAANTYPSVDKINDPGFWVRWDLVRWRIAFKSEADILPNLVTPESLSGIANLLLPILKTERERGFSFVPSDAEVKEAWLGEAEPARVFLPWALALLPGGTVSKVELFEAWERYRAEHKYAKVSETRFNALVREIFGAVEVRIRPKGRSRQLRCWSGVMPRKVAEKQVVTGLTAFFYTNERLKEEYNIGGYEKIPSIPSQLASMKDNKGEKTA